jgi:broad specificity phosphatase PhoE
MPTFNHRHSDAALANGKDDYQEHMEGMEEAAETMKSRPLLVRAYAMDDPEAPSLSSNVKHVHFVRHGQGFHNLMADLAKQEGRVWENCTNTPENPYVMPEITDAPLTAKGREQAALLQPVIAALNEDQKPQLVVLSPNCRALQTGVIAFRELLTADVPFLAHEMVREETGIHVCDKRRPTSQQASEFPMVDFSLLTDEEDAIFQHDKRETKAELTERIYTFFEWLETRDETIVGVSSHSAWLLAVFNANLQITNGDLKGWFQTGEMRSVVLEFVSSS